MLNKQFRRENVLSILNPGVYKKNFEYYDLFFIQRDFWATIDIK